MFGVSQLVGIVGLQFFATIKSAAIDILVYMGPFPLSLPFLGYMPIVVSLSQRCVLVTF